MGVAYALCTSVEPFKEAANLNIIYNLAGKNKIKHRLSFKIWLK